MAMFIATAAISLIACHEGPADHFATYADVLTRQGYEVQIYATGPALKKFQERGIAVQHAFSLDNLTDQEEENLAQAMAKTCSTASLILTDVGHRFDVKIHQALNVQTRKISHWAYYDNPEPLVPGGYSVIAAEVMDEAEGVWFANDTLAHAKIYRELGKEINLADKPRMGIGYYPIAQADKIAEKRKVDHNATRTAFLIAQKMKDRGQKIWVYFGGNNEEYFTEAFPAFLDLFAKASQQIDLKNSVIVIQQHPGALSQNRDGQQFIQWLRAVGHQPQMPKIVISDFSSDQAQVLADAAFYYQTSMGPQFILEGIPTVQIGHQTYEDIVVRNHLATSATSAEGLVQAIQNLGKKEFSRQDLLEDLGIREDWPKALEQAIQSSLDKEHLLENRTKALQGA